MDPPYADERVGSETAAFTAFQASPIFLRSRSHDGALVCVMAIISIQHACLTWRVAEKGLWGRICSKHPPEPTSEEVLTFAAAASADAG